MSFACMLGEQEGSYSGAFALFIGKPKMYGDFLNFEQLYLLHFRVLYIFRARKYYNSVVFLHFTVKMNGIYPLTLNTLCGRSNKFWGFTFALHTCRISIMP